ncbi:hypothetical protein AAHE18_13G188400 [Arachis hypogaea]
MAVATVLGSGIVGLSFASLLWLHCSFRDHFHTAVRVAVHPAICLASNGCPLFQLTSRRLLQQTRRPLHRPGIRCHLRPPPKVALIPRLQARWPLLCSSASEDDDYDWFNIANLVSMGLKPFQYFW